jgi:ATP-dependent RNA helicase DDX19/DBP5
MSSENELVEKVQELSTNEKILGNTENTLEGTEKEKNVTVQLHDPNQLYQSATTFEELKLSPELLKGIYALGYQKPSKIQAEALPLLLLDDKNMIGQSQAGTGKTACFSLDILSKVDCTLDQPQALVLAPARELARQILDNIRDLGKYTAVTSKLCVPGSVERNTVIKSHVCVGTPGTMMDLLKKRQISLQHIKIFVLDEADSMLDQQGLGDTSIRIKNMLPKCQIVLFSATFPKNVLEFGNKVAPNANRIILETSDLSVDSIKQFYMDCKNQNDKLQTLCSIYGLLTIGQSIIFVRVFIVNVATFYS